MYSMSPKVLYLEKKCRNLAFFTERVQRACDFKDAASGDMGVPGGCFYGRMAKEFLDISDIGSIFEEVGGKGMTEGMY